MTTANEILTRARHPMRDSAEEFYSDAELLDYLNEAIADLCSRERLIREETTIAVTIAAGVVGAHLVIPANFLQVRWAKNGDGEEVSWLDESTFFSYKDTYPDWPSTSPLATIYDDKIFLHPGPATAENWYVGNLQTPTVLTATSDTFPLRRIWEGKCVQYLQSEMYARDGELELSRRKHGLYEAGLRPSQAVTDHQVPGRLAIAFEPNVFDVDPEAIHRGV